MQPLPDANDDKYEQIKQNERSKRKIKPEIFFFHTNIAGQMADPVQFIAEKINDDAD